MRPSIAPAVGRLGTETAFDVLVRARALEHGREIVHLEFAEPDFETPRTWRRPASLDPRRLYALLPDTPACPSCARPPPTHLSASRGIADRAARVSSRPARSRHVLHHYRDLRSGRRGRSTRTRASRSTSPRPLRGRAPWRAAAGGARLQLRPGRARVPGHRRARASSSSTRPEPDRRRPRPEADLWRPRATTSRTPARVLTDEIYSRPPLRRRVRIDRARARSARALDPPRRPLEVVRDDRLAPRLRARARSLADPSCASSSTRPRARPPFVQLAGRRGPRGRARAGARCSRSSEAAATSLVDGPQPLPYVSCTAPRGRLLRFPNVAGAGVRAAELADRLLDEAGVAALSGTSFGARGRGYLRLSYANSLENLEQGARAHARLRRHAL